MLPYIHKINEASGSKFEEVKDSGDIISGRYAHIGELFETKPEITVSVQFIS